MTDEAGLITRYFAGARAREDVLLGIGDDAALLAPPAGEALLACTDMLTEGVHFPRGTPSDAVGHKALAVNLSDVAAMGGRPLWALVALSLEHPDPRWLEGFSAGLRALAGRVGLSLVGGDLCRGPLSVTVTVLGSVRAGRALRRGGARPGDTLWVSGTLGDAGLGLAVARRQARLERAAARSCMDRLNYPQPRLALGRWLGGRASAAIDVSDGLMIDLERLCAASAVGAVVDWARVPLSGATARWIRAQPQGWRLPLTAGDDYELLFTLPPQEAAWRMARIEAGGVPCTRIGEILEDPGLWIERDGRREPWTEAGGFDHFGAAG